MIDLKAAIPTALSRLRKLERGAVLELLTCKRDRGVAIRRTGDDAFEVREFGYRTGTVTADLKGMKKLLRTLLKREFPRSKKIHVREHRT